MSFVKWMNGAFGRAARIVAGVVLAAVGLVPLAAGAVGVCLLAPLMHVRLRAH